MLIHSSFIFQKVLVRTNKVKQVWEDSVNRSCLTSCGEKSPSFLQVKDAGADLRALHRLLISPKFYIFKFFSHYLENKWLPFDLQLHFAQLMQHEKGNYVIQSNAEKAYC